MWIAPLLYTPRIIDFCFEVLCRSANIYESQIDSFFAKYIPMYSGLKVEVVIHVCFLDRRETALSATINTKPLVRFRLLLELAQSESEKSSECKVVFP